jgi:hypothetical protein
MFFNELKKKNKFLKKFKLLGYMDQLLPIKNIYTIILLKTFLLKIKNYKSFLFLSHS